MRIHTKLILAIMISILTVVIIAQAIQYSIVSYKLSNLARENSALLKENEEEFAKNIHSTIEKGISGSLERGEMEKFDDLVRGLKAINGLKEFSLFNDVGLSTYSSHVDFLDKKINPKINEELYRDKDIKILWEESSIDIYTPQLIDADCIRCHMQFKEGEIYGITLFRFSTDKLINANIQSEKAISGMKNSFLLTSVVTCVLLIVILSITVYVAIRLVIVNPLDHMGQRVNQVTSAAGDGNFDLTIRMDTDRKDKIGEFSSFINLLLSKLHEMISSTVANVDVLHNSSTELMAVSRELLSSADQTADKSTENVKGTERMSQIMAAIESSMESASQHVTSVATAASELVATISEIAKNTEYANKISTDALHTSKKTTDQVAQLKVITDEITTFAETIEDISDQTNLLALNATIEASRAGDAGKGFAVVANEIKALATQTADATQEIKNKIAGIQSSTTQTVKDVDHLVNIIQDVNDIATSIASAMEEQLVSTNEIAENMNQTSVIIESVNGEISDGSTTAKMLTDNTNDVNSSTRAMNQQCMMVHDSGEKLLGMAEKQSDMISKFKI